MAIVIDEPVQTEAELRAILPRWPGNAARKDHDRINEVAAAFIARSPYLMISSVGAVGRHDVSPKGEAPGFLRLFMMRRRLSFRTAWETNGSTHSRTCLEIRASGYPSSYPVTRKRFESRELPGLPGTKR